MKMKLVFTSGNCNCSGLGGIHFSVGCEGVRRMHEGKKTGEHINYSAGLCVPQYRETGA